MAVLNPPNVCNLVTQVNNDQTNPLKRKKPNDTPDTSPQASVNSLAIAEIDVEEDTEGRKYIEVVCGGRTGKLILNKFHKLEGNKRYTKCIEYNGEIIPTQENLRS